MKHIFQTIILGFFLSYSSFAQSISINPNSLSLPNVGTLATCDASAKGQQVFLTTDNKVYYCNGTTWQGMTGGELSLPHSSTLSSTSTLLNLKNTGSGNGIISEASGSISVGVTGKSTSYIGTHGISSTYIGIYGESTSGTGGYFTSQSGNALGIAGKFNVNGSTGTVGSKLEINSNGLPQWQNAIAFSAKDVGANNFSVVNNTDVKIPFIVEDYDLDNDFANNSFTAPVTGIYHFDAAILWNAPAVSTGYFGLSLMVNNSIYLTTRTPASQSQSSSNAISIDVALNAGAVVDLYAFQSTGVSQTINNSGAAARFTGRLVNRR